MNARSQVTVWTASTDEALDLADASACLVAEERRHAARLRQKPDRDRYLAARALLRHALTQASGGQVSPAIWRICEGPKGKPVMAPGLLQFEFNISHAGECVAVGVSSSGPIGVDIEKAVPGGGLAIVDDVLSDRERGMLCRTPGDRQWATFIQLWTVKEACAKALGLGVAFDFHKLEVSLDPLCVMAPPGLPGPGLGFGVETRKIVVNEAPYRLGIAHITTAAGGTDFRYRELKTGLTARSSNAMNVTQTLLRW